MGSVNDIYRLDIRGSQQGQDIVNTLHFKSAVVGTDAAIQQDLIDSWQASSQASWLGVMCNPYTLVDLRASRVCGNTPLPAPTIETVNLPGSRGSVPAANQTPPWMAALVREKTGYAGREYAGRTFIPMQADGDVGGTTLEATYLTLINAYLTSLASFLAGGADTDWDLFVRSTKLAAAPGVACQDTGAVVTNLSVHPFVTTQRSRRSRSGA